MDTTTTTPPMAGAIRFDRTARTAFAGAGAVIGGALLGIVLGAWDVQPFALVMIALGLTVAGGTYAATTMELDEPGRRLLPIVQRVAATVATAVASLALIELVGDLDDLDDTGGVLGLAVAVIVVAGAVTMLVATTRGATPAIRTAPRGTRLAVLGAGLVLAAWVLHLTVGFWSFGPAVWGLAAIVLAAAVLVFASPDGRTSSRVGWIAAGLGAFTALTALGQWSELMRLGATRLELGPGDLFPFLVYVAGIGLVIAGGVIQATGGRIALPSTTLASDRAAS